MVVDGKNSFTHRTMAGGTFNSKEMYQMTLQQTIRDSEEYVKFLQEADSVWEAKSKTLDWTFEVLKNPRLRTRPSQRTRHVVCKDVKRNRHFIFKSSIVTDEIMEGYVFDCVEVNDNGVTEFYTKGADHE